jgi:hypothetical protein
MVEPCLHAVELAYTIKRVIAIVHDPVLVTRNIKAF